MASEETERQAGQLAESVAVAIDAFLAESGFTAVEQAAFWNHWLLEDHEEDRVVEVETSIPSTIAVSDGGGDVQQGPASAAEVLDEGMQVMKKNLP